MTALKKHLWLIVCLILIGCGEPPPGQVEAPPARNQPPPALPIATPVVVQSEPVSNLPVRAEDNPAHAPTETNDGAVEDNQQTSEATTINTSSDQPKNESESTVNTSNAASDHPPAAPTDLTRLPIGDHQVSTRPQRGYVWACQTNFDGGGAFATGEWFHADSNTFDYTAKPVVDGQVTWPYQFTISLNGNVRVVASNDLPNHPTGVYPVSSTDDAYQYDRNPNAIAAQSIRFELSASPSPAAQPSCIGGTVGILLTGVLLFNAFDAEGRDAVAHELQDGCQGHPEAQGNYHYHNLTSCLDDQGGGHSPLVGYAFDGFGIYGHHGQNGETLTNADLDACHGHTHVIEWDGQQVEMYHYHATWEFPYTVGCYRGTATIDLGQLLGGQNGPPSGQPSSGQPPQSQPPQGQPTGGQPDLAAAATRLGVSEQQLRQALGPPPQDFAAAAQKLGITEAQLRQALGVP